MAVIKTVLVLLSILFLSKGDVPKIPETFSSDIDVERHTEGQTHFGTGILARDQTNKKGVEYYNISIVEANAVETDYRLERYDMDPPMEYHIRGIEKDPHLHCSEGDVKDPTLKPYFGWVENAKDLGVQEVGQNLKVHLYVYEFAGTRLELGVDPDNMNTPLILTRETTGEEVSLRFKTFNTTVDASEFEVPKICQSLIKYDPVPDDKGLLGGDN